MVFPPSPGGGGVWETPHMTALSSIRAVYGFMHGTMVLCNEYLHNITINFAFYNLYYLKSDI